MKAQRKRQEERVHAPASVCVCVCVCVLPQFVTIAMKMVARHNEHDPWTAAHKVYQYKQHKDSYHALNYTIDCVCECVHVYLCEWMNTVDLLFDLTACSFVSFSFLNSIGYSQQPADTFVSTQMHTWVHTHTYTLTHMQLMVATRERQRSVPQYAFVVGWFH